MEPENESYERAAEEAHWTGHIFWTLRLVVISIFGMIVKFS